MDIDMERETEEQDIQEFADWMHREMRCEGEKVTINGETFVRLTSPTGADVVQATAIYNKLHATLAAFGASGMVVDPDFQDMMEHTARAILDEMMSIDDVNETIQFLARVCRNLVLTGRVAGKIERYRLEHPKAGQPANVQ
jgi:hypothetical protein